MNDQPISVAPAGGTRAPRWWFIGVTAIFFLSYAFWPQRFVLFGIPHYDQWFVDSYAILAANDAVAQGLNPYDYNPLDYFGRPHVYSHWWLRLGDVGLTRAHNFWLGLAWVAGFFAVALTWLRPRTGGAAVGCALLLCSGPVLMAVDRANNDLVSFILLAAVVPGLLARQRAWRWLTVLWIALATGLKYYPAVAALVLLVGDDVREVRWRVGLMVAALVCVGLSLRHDLADLAAVMPQPRGLYRFGATAIFEPLAWSATASKVAAGLLAAVIFVLGWRSRWLAVWAGAAEPGQRREYLGFVLGAALLCGCFWAGMNFGYRWIFALWLAPWLWRRVADRAGPPAVRRFALGLAVTLLIAVWSDALISAALRPALARLPITVVMPWAQAAFQTVQPVVWLCFGALLMTLAQFCRQAWQRVGPAASNRAAV